MDLQLLRRLLKLFDSSSAAEMELETETFKLRLSKYVAGQGQANGTAMPVAVSYPSAPIVAPPPPAGTAVAAPPTPQDSAETAGTEATAEPAPSETEGLHVITSPIVGTFYRAPAPDAEPFVKVGDHVNPGDTLCIVEAMKLMNEIESDIAGTVVKILVENAQPVEYGQPLFYIKPD